MKLKKIQREHFDSMSQMELEFARLEYKIELNRLETMSYFSIAAQEKLPEYEARIAYIDECKAKFITKTSVKKKT